MARNPFDDNHHSDDDLFGDDPFGDSHALNASNDRNDRHQQQRISVDDGHGAVALHSVRRSEDNNGGGGGFFSNVGGFGGSYSPLGGKPAAAAAAAADAETVGDSNRSTTKVSGGGGYNDDTSREAELRRREEALEARERELREREAHVQSMASNGARPPLNFPPLYHIMYHAIDVEVPAGDRKTVRTMFYSWLALEAMLVFNCVACLVVMVTNPKHVSNTGASFGSSFVYLFTITGGSFFLWYRPIYNAYMKDSSMFFYLFFIFNAFHILFDAYMAVGVPGAGSAGIIVMLQSLHSNSIAAGAMCGIGFSLWVLHLLVSLFMYRKIRSHYKVRGHTFAEAKQQAYVGFAQSNAGQTAVSTAAGAYMRSNTDNFV